jgi:hypothetical protein
MTLSEREEALRKCTSVRQILCPAPPVDYMFLKAYQIDYLCTTPDTCEIYSELDLGEGLVILNPPVKLSSKDLIARVISSNNHFVKRCLDHGFSRMQLDVSLFKELSLKLISFTTIANWAKLRFKLLRDFTKRGRKFFKRITEKVDYLENAVKEALVGNVDE